MNKRYFLNAFSAEGSTSNPWKSVRDNPKIFTGSEKKKRFLKSEKIYQIVMFFGKIIVEEFNLKKLLQILIKLLNPQMLFCKSQTSLGAPFSLPEPKFGTSYHYVYGWRIA